MTLNSDFDGPFDFARRLALFAEGEGEGEGGGKGAGEAGAGAGGEGGAGDGEGGAGGEGEDKDKGAGAGADGAAGEGAERYQPEGIDPADLGETDRETIDRLAKRAKGLRDALAKGGQPPKSADEYPAIEFDPAFVEKFGDPAKDDAAVALVRDAAMAAGVPAALYQGFVKEVLQRAVEGGLVDRPLDLNAEIEAAGGKEAYDAAIADYSARIDGLVKQGRLSEKGALELKPLLAVSGGQEAVKALFGLARETGVDTGGGAGAGGEFSTKADIQAAMRDDRYNTQSIKFDQAYVDKVRAAAKRLGMGG